MCAAEAGQRGRRVLILDHAHQAGRKDPDFRRWTLQLHQPGGERWANYLSRNPHFCRSALARFHARGLHRAGRAPRHRLPRAGARPAVLRRLRPGHHRHAARRAARTARCSWAMPCTLKACRARPGSDAAGGRSVLRNQPWAISCTSLVIATGGLSIPKIGATAPGLPDRRPVPHPGDRAQARPGAPDPAS